MALSVFVVANDLTALSVALPEIEVDGVLAGTESAAQVLARQGQAAAERVTETVRGAFAAGLSWSFRVVALLALGGLVVSVLFVGGSRHAGAGARPATTRDPAG